MSCAALGLARGHKVLRITMMFRGRAVEDVKYKWAEAPLTSVAPAHRDSRLDPWREHSIMTIVLAVAN